MAGTTTGRLAWPDVAKGISILGVVTLHVTLAVPAGEHTMLAAINMLLDPLRMPLFFLISGLFATKVFRFSFAELFTRRLWFFLVPYLVWVPVELYLKNREYHVVHGSEMPGIGDYLYHLVLGVNMAWFLYALILFNLLLWATRRLPPPVAMLISFLPVIALPFHFDVHMIGKAVLYLPIFFLGAHLRAILLRFAERSLTPGYLWATAGTYLTGLGLHVLWARLPEENVMAVPWPLPGAETVGGPELELVIRLLTHFLMLPAGIALSVAIARVLVVSQALQFLGRHTLPIYLGHPIALTVLYHYTQHRLQIPITPEAGHWVASTGFWIVACFAISAVGSLALWSLSRVPVLGWTVAPPALRTAGTKDASRRPAAAIPAEQPAPPTR